jgi:hypothetical protein
VNTNGNVTFDAPLPVFTPFNLASEIGTPIIAPFFADVDTRATGSDVVRYGSGAVDGHTAFGVNWANVGYFFKHADKLNSLQLVLIDRSDRHPGDADIEFNYERVLWETGDWSGGTAGLGGLSARAGYSSGTGVPGTSYEIPGSGVPGSFLDSSATGLVHHSLHSPVPGRYVFSIMNDEPPVIPVIPAPGALVLAGIGLVLIRRLRPGWDSIVSPTVRAGRRPPHQLGGRAAFRGAGRAQRADCSAYAARAGCVRRPGRAGFARASRAAQTSAITSRIWTGSPPRRVRPGVAPALVFLPAMNILCQPGRGMHGTARHAHQFPVPIYVHLTMIPHAKASDFLWVA